MDDILNKPVDKNKFDQMVEKWFHCQLTVEPRTEKILLAEDNETNQTMQKMMLMDIGYKADIAAGKNTVEGCEAALKNLSKAAVLGRDKIQSELLDKKTAEINDIRSGIYLLKESGSNAENRASKKVELRDVEKAISSIESFTTKDKEDLVADEQLLLSIIKENSG